MTFTRGPQKKNSGSGKYLAGVEKNKLVRGRSLWLRVAPLLNAAQRF